MFDQQDYYSEEEENLQVSKHFVSGKVLSQSSGSEFNHLTGEGESLLKMMQQRGLDVNENQLRKLKANNSQKEKQPSKPKQKAGFLDGGASASYQQLLKSLNKALSSADPQQASVILSHILQKKTLSEQDRCKFGVMKCKILFGLGAYTDCLAKAESLLAKGSTGHLVCATLSNYVAKSKAQLNEVLEGYMDFLRAKAHIEYQKLKGEPVVSQSDEFADSQIDTISREIDHTELEYNIKMAKYKNSTNLIHPYFPQFRHRQVHMVVAGDHHALFLVGRHFGKDGPSEVFGIGENSVGQVLGRPTDYIKQPTILVELSGKGIKGVAASRQSSLAWDESGRIYEWGIKEQRNQEINITFQLKQKIAQLQKGYQHYAVVTSAGKFYTWGSMSFKGASIYKQPHPFVQPGQNIVSASCGTSHIIAIDTYGDAFALGSNEFGQLGLQAQLHAKIFKKITNPWLGPVRKVVCIGDVTFFVTRQEQLFFCGKISHNKPSIEKIRQGEFTGNVRHILSISGNTGNYYITTSAGELYHWDVDNSVKFKIEKQNEKVPQRGVAVSRGSLFKIRSLIVPQLTKVKMITEQPKSFEDIEFLLTLFDRYGPYGSPSFLMAPKCQIFLSTYPIKADDLLKENKLFLDSFQLSGDDTGMLLNEIVENRLIKFTLSRDEQSPECFKLTIANEQSGKYYFYLLIEETLVHSQQIKISVSDKEQELSTNSKKEKEMKEQERKRKAELEKQRLLEEKLRRQTEQEQRRKQTQRRAEQAYKKHLRQQEQLREKAEQERKARKQMMTGGGFDLSKYKAKNQKNIIEKEKIQIVEKVQQPQRAIDPMLKSSQSFLPDINARPNSRRKINLPSKNSITLSNFDSVRVPEKTSDKNILKPDEFMGTNINLFKSESIKQKQKETKPLVSAKGESLSKTGVISGGKVVLKRGLSNRKK